MAINENQVVSMKYELKDVKSGEIIDTNINSEPLVFIVGKGQIIPGLESEIRNLSQGDNSEIEVSPKDGYGEYDKSAVQSLPKEQFAGLELKEGMTLYGEGEDGGAVQVIVKNFDDEKVHVDFNHPLAGKSLLFSVNISDVREATSEELANGFVGVASSGCGCDTGGSCHTTKEPETTNECCGGNSCK